MKYLTLIIALILLFACAQTDKKDPEQAYNDNQEMNASQEIPLEVVSAFKEKFPEAQSVEWELDGEIFEAEFKIGEEEYEAEYDKDGNWIATEQEIELDWLPEPVVNSIKEAYPDQEIAEAESYNSAEFGDIYEIEIMKDGKEIEIFIDKEGKILKTEIEEAEEDKEKDDDD